MTPPDDSDDDERTVVRPPSARAGGAMSPSSSIAFPTLRTLPDAPVGPGFARSALAAPGHVLSPGTRLRDYEITGLIGEGGFGIVYLAWDHSLQRKVAIKEYMPASMVSRVSGSSAIVIKSDRHLDTFKAGLKSFVNEARLLARFDHPSLVKVYRFWEENGTAYMVMPFYEGPTLKTALAELGHVPSEAELRTWLDPLLDALTVMHAAQCFHRDIAPDNILLTSSGPLLLDFGAARRVIGDMTHALTVVLKPGYAPIEQYGDVASMSQGAWTDIYALACVVYYAITGKTPMSSVERLMDDRLEPIAVEAAGRYSRAFLRAIDAALSVRPSDRPQSEAQFRALLDADRPQAEPPPASAGAPGQRHDPVGATGEPAYTTVPATLMPELATQILVRPAEATTPPAEPLRSSAPKPDAYEPTAFSPRAAEPAVPVPMPLPTQAQVPRAMATASPAQPRLVERRGTATIIASTFVVVAIGAVAFWAWQQHNDGSTPESTAAGAASAIAQVRPASGVALPIAEPAPVASAVVSPTAAASALASPPDASTVAASTMPAPTFAASSVNASVAETSAAGAASATSTVSEPVATMPSASPPIRPRREPAKPRSQPAADATRDVPAATPVHRSVGSRCSDILQKASLEPLTAEEAAYLRRECR